MAQFKVYQPFIDYLKTNTTPSSNMIDWCSGSGEPAISIYQASGVFQNLELTDKFPSKYNGQASDIAYHAEAIDVLQAPVLEATTYTMFNAFHHFETSNQLKIIKRLKDNNANAFIVEILAPDFLFYFKILLTTTIGTLLLTPFLKPFSFKRLFFTYIFPINIFTITYDGLVSGLQIKICKAIPTTTRWHS